MTARLTDRVPRLTQIAAGVVALAVGLSVVAGWHLGSETLVRIRPGLPAMQYPAAICFAVAGAALVLAASGRSKLAGITGLLLSAAGALSLTQDFLHVDRDVDHIFGLISALTTAGIQPARVAPFGAVCFLSIGAVQFLRRIARPPRVWPVTAFCG
jgi:hypothetical protein